jgi:hypothetical protein
VLGGLVEKGVEDTPAVLEVLLRRVEVCLVEIAPRAGINEVVVAVVAACRERVEMFDGELATGVRLGYTAVSTTLAVALSDDIVARVGRGANAPMRRRDQPERLPQPQSPD